MSKHASKNEKNALIILYEGKFFTVEYAIDSNGVSLSKKFIESLEIGYRAKIIALIKRYANHGRIQSRQQFKKLVDHIWEFKKDDVRVLMYHCAPSHIALTNGFFKKQPRTPSQEIKRAIRIKEEYDSIRKD
jgi:phage-related protein